MNLSSEITLAESDVSKEFLSRVARVKKIHKLLSCLGIQGVAYQMMVVLLIFSQVAVCYHNACFYGLEYSGMLWVHSGHDSNGFSKGIMPLV